MTSLEVVATVKNTKHSTTNWLKKFNDHCKEYVLNSNIDIISDQKQLESNLVHFFSYAKCANKEEYSMNSVLLAIAAFQHYITEKSPLKGINLCDKQQFPTLNTLLNRMIKWLSTKCKGETKGSESLTLDECLHILKHNSINENSEDKHVEEKRLRTYLRYIVIASEIDISNHRITNQSKCKTTIQLLKSFEASDYEYMAITRHKSQTDQVNPLLNKKAILITSTATTTQATSATPTFQTAKKILQDSQLNNIESVTLSTKSLHELFEKFNKLSQETIYNNSNITYHIHHHHYYNTSPSQ
ncbi:3138_t:CDS:2 [Cetraspora pellucida]|uniref:3138_t:CDS:1 n=1 Tax=Cetraspora pellucida TaxID=1433469 RepID=A0A9N9GRC5_9GLOM|nr:3138_t:CDS:2 [Cetraspora pellucida]